MKLVLALAYPGETTVRLAILVLIGVQDTGRVYTTDGCDSWNAELKLPCWPCYRDGFRSPNPEESANGDEGDEEPEADTPRRSEPADFGYGKSTGVQHL